MVKSAFEHCTICKVNHADGRRHVYTSKHKSRLQLVLVDELSRYEELNFWLSGATHGRKLQGSGHWPETTQRLKGLWCRFCNRSISNEDDKTERE